MTEQRKIRIARRIVKLFTVFIMILIPTLFIVKTLIMTIIGLIVFAIYLVTMWGINIFIKDIQDLLWAKRASECSTYKNR